MILFRQRDIVLFMIVFGFYLSSCSNENNENIKPQISAKVSGSASAKPSCCSAKPSRFGLPVKSADKSN